MNETIFTFDKLYRAYLDCRKTKRKTINALKFEWNMERNLFQLQKELAAKRYYPGRSICFVVKDPCPREIFAASFRDRVVHHLLVKEVEEIGEKSFIFDSFSCRKGKGTHLAVKRLKAFIRRATENYKREVFYLQLDISGFFMSIDHSILYSFFKEMIFKQNQSCQRERDLFWLARIIIFYRPTENYITKGDLSLFKLIPSRKSLFHSSYGQGLPIGNYSSQFFANLYLNKFDHFIKRKLGSRYYLRYVDDFILLDKNSLKLKKQREEIKYFLKRNLKLKLSLKKQKLQPLKTGVDFLGYFLGYGYILVRQKVVRRFKNRLRLIRVVLKEKVFKKKNKESLAREILAVINSYYGHFRHAFSFNLRKDIYEYHLDNIQKRFSLEFDYSFLKSVLGNFSTLC